MFLCDKCLTTKYKNHESLCKRVGPCESCGYTLLCNDIPSKDLVLKEIMPKVTNVQLEAAIARGNLW